MNLLENPGFEADWGEEESHEVIVALPDGAVETRQIGNIFSPPGWTTWFYHDPGNYDQPEVRDTREPNRVYSGNKAILLFTFFRRHLAGFLQQVEVTPGKTYRASALAHAWSNWQDGPHEDDPAWSEGPGYDAGYLLKGGAPNDEWRNFTFSVGVDLLGGLNPFAQSVVWGTDIHIYNEYGPVLSPAFEAGGSIATVFLRSHTEWAYKHNDAYWDDAVLIEMGAPPECRGLPRIDYRRTVNVVPYHKSKKVISKKKAREVLEKTWPQTISNSYDDAGIGDLTDKTAVLWDIPKVKQQDYSDFYDKFYPGTQVEFKYTDDWSEPSNWDQYLLWQGDPRWGDTTFGPGNCTMKNTACFITCLAMAQRVYEIDKDATPLTVNDALGLSGYAQPCNARWPAITEHLGMTVSSSTKAQADAHINGGGVMLIEVLPAEMQHFVLAVEVLGDDNYLILDPYKNVIAPLKNLYAGWESWRMLTKNDPAPPPPPPPPGPGPQLPHRDSLIGLHLQTRMEGDEAYIRQLGTGVVKCFSFEDAAYFKSINSNVVTSVRMHTKEQHIGGDPMHAVARYIATFYDSLVKYNTSTDYIESWNECINSSNREANLWFVEFHRHFAYTIDGLDLHTKACILNTAVGNPLEDWVVDLIPAARAAYETGGSLGYHGYWWCNPSVDGVHEMDSWWPWHAGRWQKWDEVFASHGIYPKYILGEVGAVGSSDGYALNPNAGWKSTQTLKGDWGRYFAQIAHFQANLREWNAAHGNRALGATLFTTGQDFVNWLNFQVRKPEMEVLATLS